MKSFITSIIIAVIIVCGSLLYMSQLEAVSDRLGNINEEASQALYYEDYPLAQSKIKELESELESCEPFFAALGNHEEIDAIESNLAELKSYAEHEHKSDALAKCNVLSFLFNHLPRNSRLKIENIL